MTKNNYGITPNTVLTDELVLSICINPQGKMKGVVASDKWLADHPELRNYLKTRYSDSQSVGETLYRMFHKLEVRPVCPVCGKPLKFKKFREGFTEHCSIACLNKDPNHIEKCATTCVARYGGKSAMCSEQVQEKSKQTCLEKYGVKYSLQSKEVRDKSVQTCLEKYGTERYMLFGSEEYKNLIQERYGVINPFQAEEVKEKIKQSNLSKYGFEHASQSEQVKEKVRQTNLEKFGVTSYTQTDEYKRRAKQTNLERYGVEYASQSEVVIEKCKETCKQRYGVEYCTQSPIIQAKIRQTFLRKYEVEHALQYKEFGQKVINTKRKNHTFNTSSIEKSFEQYLRSKYEIKTQYQSELYPFLCDFYIPSLDLYIEINGTWTHGRHPFDPNNQKDTEILEKWKLKNTDFYKSAIRTWTVRDPLKLQTAKENNLHYLSIYSYKLQTCIEQFENYVKTLEGA